MAAGIDSKFGLLSSHSQKCHSEKYTAVDTTVTSQILLFFDILLVLTLLLLAWQSLNTDDIFKGVVLFISFGLLMALSWVRLRAPDVALAEAALGAGLTGPLFLSALRRMNRLRKGERRLDADEIRGKNHEQKKK